MSVQNPNRQYHIHGGIRHIGTTPYRCVVATTSHKKAIDLIGISQVNFRMFFNEKVTAFEKLITMLNKETVYISRLDLDPPVFEIFKRRG